MAWTTPLTWVSQAVTAALYNQQIRDNMNETAPGIASAEGRMIITSAANTIVERLPTTAYVGTSETTASTSYTDLATAGPEVTLGTGTKALVILSATLRNTTTDAFSRMGYAVSSATTVAATSARALATQVDEGDSWLQASAVYLHTSLTAGSNVFTAKYLVSAGTGAFLDRHITVIPF